MTDKKSVDQKTTLKTGRHRKAKRVGSTIIKKKKNETNYLIATMLLTFGFANAQSKIYGKVSGYENYEVNGKCEGSKIYQKVSGYENYEVVGKYEGSKICQKVSGYENYEVVGKYEGGKIYQKVSGYENYEVVGKYEGGKSIKKYLGMKITRL